jgi:hypothetical protein
MMKSRLIALSAAASLFAASVGSAVAASRVDVFSFRTNIVAQASASAGMQGCHGNLLQLLRAQRDAQKAFRQANPMFGMDKAKRDAYVAMLRGHADARLNLIRGTCMPNASMSSRSSVSSVSTSRSSTSSQSSMSSISSSRSSMSSSMSPSSVSSTSMSSMSSLVSSVSSSRSSVSSNSSSRSSVSSMSSRSSVSSSMFWPGFPF